MESVAPLLVKDRTLLTELRYHSDLEVWICVHIGPDLPYSWSPQWLQLTELVGDPSRRGHLDVGHEQLLYGWAAMAYCSPYDAIHEFA